MPARRQSVPSYRLHRSSGQAVVTIDNKDRYLGLYDTEASHARYDVLIATWLAAGRPGGKQRDQDAPADPTVAEVCAAFLKFATGYYRGPDGRPTSQLGNVRAAMRAARLAHADTPASSFGPRALKEVRDNLVRAGLTRRECNRRCQIIVQVFRWAAGEEMVRPEVPAALACLAGLRQGRSEARETEPIKPVDFEVVSETLPFLSATVAAMARLAWATGARPGEVCGLKVEDIDRSGDLWKVALGHHKTRHHGKARTLFLGPVAQEVLAPLLEAAGPSGHVFRPSRVTRVRGKKPPPTRYTSDSFAHAIKLGVVRANRERAAKGLPPLPTWTPNQLRHAAATRIRAALGVEVARTVLGHSRLDVTEIYAERDQEAAADAMRQLG
jgi:integrase